MSKHMKKGTLFLVPGLLGAGDPRQVLGADLIETVSKIRYFICENQKNAIRLLVGCGLKDMLDQCEFGLLNEHTRYDEYNFLMEPLMAGKDAAILSDAGCPGVADPGAELVALAHLRQLEVIPLVGPTSIILALMGSGLNGQSFAFHGYLPVPAAQRIKRIRQLQDRSVRSGETQIFIEAPYRNRQLLNDLLSALSSETRLCIAANLTQSDQLLQTKPVAEWKKKVPDIHKIPTVFLF